MVNNTCKTNCYEVIYELQSAECIETSRENNRELF